MENGVEGQEAVTEIWSPAQEFPVWRRDGLPVIFSPAELDINNVARLDAAMLAVASDSARMVVDMTATRFCGCCTLDVLVRAQARARARGGEIRLVVATPMVRRIFAVTGLSENFSIYPTLTTALSGAPAADG